MDSNKKTEKFWDGWADKFDKTAKKLYAKKSK